MDFGWWPIIIAVLLLAANILLLVIAHGIYSLIWTVNHWRINWESNPREATEKQMDKVIEHLRVLSDEIESKQRRELRERYEQ